MSGGRKLKAIPHRGDHGRGARELTRGPVRQQCGAWPNGEAPHWCRRCYGVAIQFQVFQFACAELFTPEAYWLVDQTLPLVAPVAAIGSGLAPA